MTAGPSPNSYSVWDPPGAVFPVHYPFSVLREIDFFVVDAYRCIPYGGLEVGAILYGRGEPSGVTILAHRPIECEHSRGPTFVLSAADLETLVKQVAKPFITEDGDTLDVVGWAVSNCRSDLVLTEQEAQIYDQFFPGPRQLTLLAKPEKMKATRFGFLAHPPRGGILERACRDSFILPLSTKGEATNRSEFVEQTSRHVFLPEPSAAPVTTAPVPQLPPDTVAPLPPESVIAIQPEAVAPAPPQESSSETPLIEMPHTEVLHTLTADVPLALSLAEPEPLEPDSEQVAPKPEPPVSQDAWSATEAVDSAPAPEEEPASSEAVIPLAPVAEDPPPPEGPPPAEPVAPTVTPAIASVAEPPVDLPAQAAQPKVDSEPGRSRERSTGSISSAPAESQPEPPSRSKHTRKSQASALEIVLGILILCLLAFAATWTYLRLQSTPIPLNAEVQAGQVVLTWPPEFTLNSGQASITTWTGNQPATQAVLAGEQTEGKAIIATTGADVTFQLRVPHWYQDRTGQIRVLRVVPPPAPPAPPKPVRRVFAAPGYGSAAPTAGRPSPGSAPQ
jgi:hypothetical protein